MRMRRAGMVIAGLLALGACSTAQQSLESAVAIDYKSAGSAVPPLEIPPDLTAPTRDSRYAVPDGGRAGTTLSAYQADRAQRAQQGNTQVLPDVPGMRIDRAGTQRWLVVEDRAEKVWPRVRDFWQQNGFLIKIDQPEAGVMETDWAENRAKLPQEFLRGALGKYLGTLYSTAERDMFRTRLERGAGGATEVYISHRGMVEVVRAIDSARGGAGDTIWEPRPTDPDLEAVFLQRLMLHLGLREEQARAVASVSSAPERAKIRSTTEGGPMLEVNEPFDRAWRRVGLALDRVGFTVEDRDRQKGLYFVRYADPEAQMDRKDKEKTGFFGNLAFWSSKEPIKTEQYQVSVRGGGDNSQVRVLGKDGAADTTGASQKILSLLHEQLK